MNNFSCSPISMSKGTVLPWVSEIRYLGIYIKQSTNSGAQLTTPKDLSTDQLTVLGKIGRIASEDITLELINTKCILFYYMVYKLVRYSNQICHTWIL